MEVEGIINSPLSYSGRFRNKTCLFYRELYHFLFDYIVSIFAIKAKKPTSFKLALVLVFQIN